jgi:hypothetical protein
MRTTLRGLVAVLIVAGGVEVADAQVWTQGRINPWTGNLQRSTVARNPWTGTVGVQNTVVNPWTGGVATNTVRANPWTGGVYRGAAVANPWTGHVGGFYSFRRW